MKIRIILLLILLFCSCGMNKLKAKSSIYDVDNYATSLIYYRTLNKDNTIGIGIIHKQSDDSNKQSLLLEYEIKF
jgi:hypothetical protein